MIAGFFVFLTFFAAGFLAVGFLAGVVAYTFHSLGGHLVVLSTSFLAVGFLSADFFALVALLAAGFWAGVVALSVLAASAVARRI